MTQRITRRGRCARDPDGTPAEKLVAAKVTEQEHERLTTLAKARGMTVSDLLRAACARFEAESDPAWCALDDELRAAIDAAQGPPEMHQLYENVRAAILADGREAETPSEAERRFEKWLHDS